MVPAFISNINAEILNQKITVSLFIFKKMFSHKAHYSAKVYLLALFYNPDG